MKRDFTLVAGCGVCAGVPADVPALQFSARAPRSASVRLLAVGDIALSGGVTAAAEQQGYEALLSDLSPAFKAGDIVFANLETPLTAESTVGLDFCAPLEAAAMLNQAGFTIVNLANNHIRTHGRERLQSTLDAVYAQKLEVLGAGSDREKARRLIRTDVNGVRIGWLGCARTLNPQLGGGPYYWEFDFEELRAAIRAARPFVDVLIVSIHIGFMFIEYPEPKHNEMAEKLTAAGANLILMHHAHVLQGVQVQEDGNVICYNLGNLLIDWREGKVEAKVVTQLQRSGAVFAFDIDREGICRAFALPTWIDDNHRVRWAGGEQGRAALARLMKVSIDLDGEFARLFDAQRAERNAGHAVKVLWANARTGNLPYLLSMLFRVRPRHLAMLLRRARAA